MITRLIQWMLGPLVKRVMVMALKPGDVIVIESSVCLNEAQINNIKSCIYENIRHRAIVFDGGLSLDSILRPEQMNPPDIHSGVERKPHYNREATVAKWEVELI